MPQIWGFRCGLNPQICFNSDIHKLSRGESSLAKRYKYELPKEVQVHYLILKVKQLTSSCPEIEIVLTAFELCFDSLFSFRFEMKHYNYGRSAFVSFTIYILPRLFPLAGFDKIIRN